MLLLVLPRHELTIQVVPTGPPSPPSSSSDLSISKSNSETYYRPSIPIIINHLKRKVEHFAAPEQYEKYDHLVRGLGRDGLLESSASQELVTREISSAFGQLELISSGEIERVYRASGAIPTSHDTSLSERAIRVSSLPSFRTDLTSSFSNLSTYSINRTAAQIAASAPITQSKNEAALKAAAKRKAPAASRGVESLKKVNTSSMNKLTSFFKPKDGAKK